MLINHLRTNIMDNMAETTLLAERINEGIDALQEKINRKQWAEYSRVSFLQNLKGTISDVKEISSLLRMVQEHYERGEVSGAPDFRESVSEYQALIEVLKRNQQMEEAMVAHSRASGDADALAPNPELYSSLESKLLQIMLKTRYVVDRMHIHERKSAGYTASETRSAGRNLLKLLEDKEKELHELKNKYGELSSKSFLARAEENVIADLEHELNDVSRKLESEGAAIKDVLGDYAKRHDELNSMRARLEGRVRQLEEHSNKHMVKSLELISLLKKERDNAKRAMLDAHHETAQARGSYSKGLMKLEEEKLRAKEEGAEKMKNRARALEKMVEEKDRLIKQMHNMVEERENELNSLKKALALKLEMEQE